MPFGQLQPMGIRAVAEGVGTFNSKVSSMNKSIDKTNKSTTKAEKTSASLGKTLRGLGAAAGVAAAAFLAARKAFDFGRQGALIIQTGESFDFLLKKIGASADLLDQLSSASRGTISELDLMTSTATLLAGAGDKLAKKLADATPQLLEIAKAANKLNPALGSTAFLYQSIATGVKRAQPLILDNLGITIKVGQANEDFAKSIGKAVDELNAEEKAMAILQGTLEAGANLIGQVGGDTASLTDTFDRLTVAITEAANVAKSKLSVALSPLVDNLADTIIASNELAEAERFLTSVGLNVKDMLARQQLGYDDLGLITETYREQVLELAERFKDVNKRVFDFGRVVQDLPPIEIIVDPPLPQLTKQFQDFDDVIRGIQTQVHIQIVTEIRAREAAGAAAELADITPAGFIPQFQHGGQFTIGGKSGVDKNLVQFMASRGEVVTVTPTSNVDNRSVNMGDINMGGGGMSPQTFDRMIRSWMGA